MCESADDYTSSRRCIPCKSPCFRLKSNHEPEAPQRWQIKAPVFLLMYLHVNPHTKFAQFVEIIALVVMRLWTEHALPNHVLLAVLLVLISLSLDVFIDFVFIYLHSTKTAFLTLK